MKKIFLLICVIIFLTSCVQILNYKEVEIVIERNHPFEKISNKNLWYTISYTDGFGNIKYYHLTKNTDKVKLLVRRGKPIFISAKALDEYSPIAGVIAADKNRVILNYEEGKLVKFLQTLYLQNPEAVCSVNYELLVNKIKKKGLLDSFNELILARDIINGNLNESSFYNNENICVSLEQAVEGYWISENPNEGGFLISDSNFNRIKLSLSSGKYYYINIEKGYQMVIIVDSSSKKYFIKVEKLPIELL